ncbi:MAG TPA: MFS transporter [Candidatus Dormibacteraeota bacterium]|nr:MFS transporter [Candidatus Dormibacteraeota bacterium]
MPLGLKPRVWLMTFGHLVIDSNNALLFALLPVFVPLIHINFAQAGSLVTVLLMTSSVTQPVFGYLQDRWPLMPLSAGGLLVAGAAMAATGFVTTYPVMLALVVVAGLGVAAFHPQAVAQAARASADRPGWGISIFFSGGSTGTGLMAFAIVPAAALVGPRATLLALVGAVVAAALFARAYRTWLPGVRVVNGPTAAASMRPVALPVSLLLAVSILRSAVMTAYLTFLPTLVVLKTGSFALGATALAVFVLSGTVGALAGGVFANQFGGAAVVLVSLVGGFALLLPAPWLPGPILVPWMVVAGVLVFASEAQVTALAQRLLPGFVGVASSLMMGVGLGLGNAGGLIAGVIADQRGVAFALTATTLLLAGAIAAAAGYMFSMRRIPPRAMAVQA